MDCLARRVYTVRNTVSMVETLNMLSVNNPSKSFILLPCLNGVSDAGKVGAVLYAQTAATRVALVEALQRRTWNRSRTHAVIFRDDSITWIRLFSIVVKLIFRPIRREHQNKTILLKVVHVLIQGDQAACFQGCARYMKFGSANQNQIQVLYLKDPQKVSLV